MSAPDGEPPYEVVYTLHEDLDGQWWIASTDEPDFGEVHGYGDAGRREAREVIEAIRAGGRYFYPAERLPDEVRAARDAANPYLD